MGHGGMTWEQVWSKYEDQVLREVTDELEGADPTAGGGTDGDGASGLWKDLDDDDLTARICLRILERSVATNEAVDRLFLRHLEAEDDDDGDEGGAACDEDGDSEEPKRRRRRERKLRRREQMQAELLAIERKFYNDIRELLRYGNLTTREGDKRRHRRWRKRRGFFWTRSEATLEVESASLEAGDDDSPAGASDPPTPARDGGAAGAPGDRRGQSQLGYPAEDLAAALFAVVSSAAGDGSR